jgi:hypothetical protein
MTVSPGAHAELAAFLAWRYGVRHMLRFGLGPGGDLCGAHSRVRSESSWSRWRSTPHDPDASLLTQSVLVADGTGSTLAGLERLAAGLRSWLDYAPCALFAVPQHAHWDTPDAFRAWLDAQSLRVEFTGLSGQPDKDTLLAVLARNDRPPIVPAPVEFRVVAIMTAYNESDIIVPTLTYLIANGIEVYLIENWSTDGTMELAQPFIGHGLIAVERFPADGPSPYFDLRGLMRQVAHVSQTLDANWFINYDVDELRESPWPGVSLRDALYHVDRCGFNCIDHTVIDFRPVNEGFEPGSDFGAHFRYFEFGRSIGYFVQMKAWRNFGQPVTLAGTGGHRVLFQGRRVYPYKFLNRHYMFRSQAHGERKVREKLSRAHPEEQKRLNQRYASFKSRPEFIWRPDDLILFEPDRFYSYFLVERLSGIGLPRQHRVGWKAKIPLHLQPYLGRAAQVLRGFR